jgi:hypothetical protein
MKLFWEKAYSWSGNVQNSVTGEPVTMPLGIALEGETAVIVIQGEYNAGEANRVIIRQVSPAGDLLDTHEELSEVEGYVLRLIIEKRLDKLLKAELTILGIDRPVYQKTAFQKYYTPEVEWEVTGEHSNSFVITSIDVYSCDVDSTRTLQPFWRNN